MSEQVMEMMTLMRQINMRLHRCLREVYEPLGLTGPQAIVMLELFQQDEQRICDLAAASGMTVSNISAICQCLERNGFLHSSDGGSRRNASSRNLPDNCLD